MDQDELILGGLDIASTNEISSLFFNLVMGKFLGQGQKATTFFAKISEEYSLANC